MIEMTYPGGMTIMVYAKDTVTIAMFERMGYYVKMTRFEWDSWSNEIRFTTN